MPKSNINHQISNIRNRKIAIVTDWIYGGGSEMVVLELHKMFPDAPIYTSYCTDEWRDKLNNKVITGYLQRRIFVKLRKFLPLLRQWWFAHLDLSGFDLVISVTGNGEAKFALSRLPQASTLNSQSSDMKRPFHISYCNTPVHFYWRHYQSYLQNPGFKPAWLARLGLKLLVKPLRRRDFQAAQKVDLFLANSTHIQNDIKAFYGRDSTFVFPPVDINHFSIIKNQISNIKPKGFITHGRLVPLKHIDLIVKACNELNLPLTVIGKGPELENLKKLAGPTVDIKGYVSDEDLPAELSRHAGYIFASFEDFGIAPVEAMATGLPVIAYKAGGALDYVEQGKTGLFFNELSVVNLTETLQSFDAKLFDSSVIKKYAEQFSREEFQKHPRNTEYSLNERL